MNRRRSSSAPLLCLLIVSMTACVSPPVRKETSLPVTVPEHWTTSDARPGDPGGEDSSRWWKSFKDPGLDRLIAETLDNNRDLRAAAARIDAASAQARIAGADLYPSVSALANGNRRRQNFIGFPSFNRNGSSGEVVSNTTTVLGVSLDTTWEIDLWGRIRAGTSAALAGLQASRAEFESARISLAGQVAKTWFVLSETDLQVDLTRRNVESFRKTVAQVRSRFSRGLRSSLDLRLALTNLHTAEGALEQVLAEKASIIRQIEVLAGRYPEGTLENRPELPPLPPPVPAGLPAELIARRPDLAAAERRLAAAGARVAEARRSLYPRLTLTGSTGRQSEEFADLLNGNFSVWSIVAGLTQPLFQGGRLRAGVELAGANEREAVELYVGAALTAYREVETALETERRLAVVERGFALASEQAAAARKLAEDRYRSGLDGFLTVLEAQRRDIDAEQRLIEIRRLRLDTRVDLHLALGGGFTLDTITLEPEDKDS